MAKKNFLQLTQVQLKNFRCFTQNTLVIESPIVVIEGLNGTGKTSILEALHYTCYLRSFRTHSPRELMRFGQDNFFVKVAFDTSLFDQEYSHQIQIGFSGGKRLVKVDQKTVSSYKELLDHYRVVSLTEDDLELIKGSPQGRRSFIDQAILLCNPEYIHDIRAFRQVVDNRNALLLRGNFDRHTYTILTEQLWEKSRIIQQARIDMLDYFSNEISRMAKQYIDQNVFISLKYRSKMQHLNSCKEFLESKKLFSDEQQAGRSLFGAHLDDFIIRFQDQKSKPFASRGQQKLIVLLLKIAQVKKLSISKGPAIFLLDDFMTDFDPEKTSSLISMLYALDNQLIFTSPAINSALSGQLHILGSQVAILTH